MTSFLLVVLYRRGLRAGAVVVVMFFSSAKLRLILKVEEQKGRKSGRNGRTDAKNDAVRQVDDMVIIAYISLFCSPLPRKYVWVDDFQSAVSL